MFASTVTQLLVPFLTRIRLPARSRAPIARIEIYRDGTQLGLWSIADGLLDAIAFVDYLETLAMLDLAQRPASTVHVYLLQVVRSLDRRSRAAPATLLRLPIRPADFVDFGTHDALCS